MRAWAMALLTMGALLAGCATSDSPGDSTATTPPATTGAPVFIPTTTDANGLPIPQLLCFQTDEVAGGNPPQVVPQAGVGTRCNFNMTPDAARQGNEVTIAVNPTDPRNVVGGAKDYFPADAGECVWDGVYVTHDGGRTTYQDRSFDGSPWRLLHDPTSFVPNYASQFWCTTDPVAYFDVNGNFYYLLMAYQADRVTGSKTCKDQCPNGALNDWAFNRATQIVAVSSDGGDTFHTFTPVLEGSFPVDFHDKGWVAASASGTIHVMWLASLLPGNLYFRSTDGGATYTDPEPMATIFLDNSGQGSFLDVGTGSQVYASWASGGIRLRKSDNEGLDWGAETLVHGINGVTMDGLSPRDRRGGFPHMATDRNPDSPFGDAIYWVWADGCDQPVWSDGCSQTGGSNVYFTASFDQGVTFTPGIKIDDAPPGTWKLFPTVSVSPGGVIDVSWMDTRLNGTGEIGGAPHPKIDQYYAYSLDGGKTWSQDFRVRDVDDQGWDPQFSHHQNGMIFFGDYNDIDSSWQAAHPVWPDTRDGAYVKVYTATILRPMFADGWDETKKAAGEAFIAAHPLT